MLDHCLAMKLGCFLFLGLEKEEQKPISVGWMGILQLLDSTKRSSTVVNADVRLCVCMF